MSKIQAALFPLFLLIPLLISRCRTPAGPPLPPAPTTPAISIALLSPQSGEMGTFGRVMRSGVIMALETHNEQGGVLGRQIAWHLYDTPCQFEPAGRAAQQALDDGLEFIIGPLCSEGAIAAAVVAQERGALMIAPAAAHPLVTVDDQGQTRPTIFTVAIDNDNHPTRQAWAEQYKSLYAVEPEMLAHLGYNAATILIAAIEQTGSFDPLDVAQALEQGTFESLGGPVTFSPEHTPAYLP